MICPICQTQMHQYVVNDEPQGDGYNDEREYYTFTMQVCDDCGRLVKEEYRAKVIKHVKDLPGRTQFLHNALDIETPNLDNKP